MSRPGVLDRISPVVESGLKSFMADRTLPLYTMMAYQLGWVDGNGTATAPADRDRIRGSLCTLSALACGGGDEAAAAHATAVELIHNYSLIHTDIQEGNPDRSGRPALWSVWGPAQGINAGDGMHALARLSLFGLRQTGAAPEDVALALRHLDSATLELCAGAYLDTVFQEQLMVERDEYMTMSRSIGGALVGGAMQLGALAAGVREGPAVEALGRFGVGLGTAFRLAEDYAAFWGAQGRDETTQGRLLAKKKTFPVVHALAEGSGATKREIGRAYMQRVLGPDHITRITELLEETGSREFTQRLIDDTLSDAKAELDEAGLPQEERADIEAVADYAVAQASGVA